MAAFCYTEVQGAVDRNDAYDGATPLRPAQTPIAANKLEKASVKAQFRFAQSVIAFRHGDGRNQDLAEGG